MDSRRRALVVTAGTVAIFLAVQVGALALVAPFESAGMQVFDDPGDPANSLLYVLLILVATGLMLLAFRLGGQRVVRAVIVLTSGLLSWYVFLVVLPARPAVGGVPVAPVLLAGAVVVGLWVYPEWWVIDAAGVVMGAGAAGLFGVSFGLAPALLLLAVLAVYDAISVYGTEHMLTLAEGVWDMKVPVLLVIPATRSFSFLDLPPPSAADGGENANGSDGEPGAAVPADEGNPDGETRATGRDDGTDAEGAMEGGPLERDALFIGLGDAVIPTVLVASAAVFLPEAPTALPGSPVTLPVAGAAVGTLLGLLVLLRMVFAGRPHAGLPLLNGGAIAGYLLAALAGGIPLATALGL